MPDLFGDPLPSGKSILPTEPDAAVGQGVFTWPAFASGTEWLSLSYEEFYELAARRGCIEIGYDPQAASRELARLAEARS